MSENTSISSKNKRRLLLLVIFGLAALLFLFMAAISVGSVMFPLSDVWDALAGIWNHGVQTSYERVIYYFRMPRAIATFAVGMGLSVAGVVFQAIIRNPLVDPYMTGVSSGAGFGVSLMVVFGTGSVFLMYLLPLAAFIGAIIAFLVTFLMASVSGGRSINFVLGGVMTAMGFGALTTIIMMVNEENSHQILSFLFGSFTTISWNNVWIIVIPVILISSIFALFSRSFNVALLGEEQSMQLGLDYHRFKILSLVLASMLTAFCVAFVGIIGFVGLVVPHLCRMILGGDHRLLIPASMIVGAILMCCADLTAKMAMSPLELPVGAVMTLIGIPFFGYLLARRGKDYAS